MKLDKVNSAQIDSTKNAEQSKVRNQANENSESLNQSKVASNKSSKVAISEEAKMISEGLSEVQKADDVRADKVAELRAAIANGTYKIDSKKIADSMLDASIEESLHSMRSKN